MKKYIVEITVFLSGAIGMMLEIIAARILSPYVGSSNLIWTTIIGVMLTSMSIGYWIGGKLADKEPKLNKLSNLLMLGAIFSSIIPILEVRFVSELAKVSNNLELIAFISATIVFGIPSFILATVSPYSVKLKSQNNDNIGKISGKISSISTIGSIVGTFVSGFILIPNLGVKSIIFSVSIILLILSISLHENRDKKYIGIIGVIVVVIILLQYIGTIMFKNANPDIIADVDSQYSRIWIKEVDTGKIQYKTMYVDTGLESYINKETNEMGAEYLAFYDLFDYFVPNTDKVLMIGGAAYTYPTHFLQKYKDKKIDVVEIDSKMTEIAVEHFDLDIENKRLNVIHQDGRSFINKTTNKYGAIVLDAFKGINAPFELTTYEAVKNMYDILDDNGVLMTNIISAIQGEEAEFIKYEYSTYKKIFDNVKVYKVIESAENTMKQNLILIGEKGKDNNITDKVEYQNLLKNELKNFSSDYEIVTDNYCPIGS